MKGAAIVLASLLAAGAAFADATPKPFLRGTAQAITEGHAGEPFVLAMWSLDCVYCRHDLAMFGRLQARHPDLRIVVVATDPPARREEIAPALQRIGLDPTESWIFADSFIERLRYEIDPGWSGELPRTYFHDAGGERIGVSGSLDEGEVETWIRAARAER